MAKVIKYTGDASKIEDSGKQAPVGLYYAKVDTIEQKTSKNNEEMVELKFVVTKDANGKKVKESYAPIYFYAPLDVDASWARRLKDLITAFALKPKGANLGTIEGKEALIRLREDTDLDGEYRPNIGKVLPAKKTTAKGAVDEDEEDEDDEEEEEDDSELAEMSRSEMKALIKEEGLEVTVRRSMSDDDLRAAIEEVRVVEDEEEEEEEDDEEEEEEIEDNYDDMGIKELKTELGNRELETTGRKPVLIARLRADDQEEPV